MIETNYFWNFYQTCAFLTSIILKNSYFQVTIGIGNREKCICRPISPSKLVDWIFGACPPDQPQIAVMQQELIIACSDLVGGHFKKIFLEILLLFYSNFLMNFSWYDISRFSMLVKLKNPSKSYVSKPLEVLNFLDIRSYDEILCL